MPFWNILKNKNTNKYNLEHKKTHELRTCNLFDTFSSTALIEDNHILIGIINRVATDIGQTNAKVVRNNQELDNDLYKLLNLRPNKWQNANTFYYNAVYSLYTNANTLIYIERAQSKVVNLKVINYNSFEIMQVNGFDVYKVIDCGGNINNFLADDIIHLKLFADEGIIGDDKIKEIKSELDLIKSNNESLKEAIGINGKLFGFGGLQQT